MQLKFVWIIFLCFSFAIDCISEVIVRKADTVWQNDLIYDEGLLLISQNIRNSIIIKNANSNTHINFSELAFIDSPINSIKSTQRIIISNAASTLIKTLRPNSLIVQVNQSQTDAKSERFEIFQNTPNPFNSQTKITYTLPCRLFIKIEVYDILGRKVKTLLKEFVDAGYHQSIWDSRDDNGFPVSSGLYIYSIKAGDYYLNHKMICIK